MNKVKYSIRKCAVGVVSVMILNCTISVPIKANLVSSEINVADVVTKSQVDDAKLKLDKLNIEIEKQKGIILEKEKELNNLILENERLLAEKEKFSNQNSSISEQINLINQQLSSLEMEYSRKQQEFQQLSAKKKTFEQEKSAVNTLIEEKLEQIRVKESEIMSLNATIKEKEAELAKSGNSDVLNRLNTAKQELEKLESDLSKLESSVQEKERNIQNINNELTNKESDKSFLEQELTRYETQLKEQQAIYTEQQKNIDDINKTLTEISKQITVSEEELSQEQTQIDNLEREIADKRQELTTIDDDISNTERIISEKSTQLNTINSELTTINQSIAEIDVIITQKNNEIQEIQRQIDEKNQNNNSEKIKELDKKIVRLKDIIKRLNYTKEHLPNMVTKTNTIILPNLYVNAIKDYMNNKAHKLAELRDLVKNGNLYKNTSATNNEVRYDVNNLPENIRTELSIFAADLINQITNQVKIIPNPKSRAMVTPSSIEFTKQVADEYVKNNKNLWIEAKEYREGFNAVAAKYGIQSGDYETLVGLVNHNEQLTYNELKEAVYKATVQLITNSSFYGLYDVFNVARGATYFGLDFSRVNGKTQAHFVILPYRNVQTSTNFDKTEIANKEIGTDVIDLMDYHYEYLKTTVTEKEAGLEIEKYKASLLKLSENKIKISNKFIDGLKRYLEATTDTEKTNIKNELSNEIKSMRYNNNFKYYTYENDVKYDVNNLPDDIKKKLNLFIEEKLNEVRKHFGTPEVESVNGAYNFADKLSDKYIRDNWNRFAKNDRNNKGYKETENELGFEGKNTKFDLEMGDYTLNSQNMTYSELQEYAVRAIMSLVTDIHHPWAKKITGIGATNKEYLGADMSFIVPNDNPNYHYKTLLYFIIANDETARQSDLFDKTAIEKVNIDPTNSKNVSDTINMLLEQATREIDKNTTELEKLEEEKRRVQSSNDSSELERRKQELQNEITEKQNNKTALENSKQQKETKKQELTTSKEQKETELQHLQQSKTQTTQLIAEKQRQVDEKKIVLNQNKEQLNTLKQNKATKEQELSVAQNLLTQTNTVIQQLSQKKQEKEEQKVTSEQNIKQLQERKTTKQNEKEQLTQQITQLNEQKTQKLQNISDIQREADSLSDDIKEKNSKINELKSKLTQLQKEKETLETEKTNQQTIFDEKTRELEVTEINIQKIREELNTLNIQKQEKIATKKELEAKQPELDNYNKAILENTKLIEAKRIELEKEKLILENLIIKQQEALSEYERLNRLYQNYLILKAKEIANNLINQALLVKKEAIENSGATEDAKVKAKVEAEKVATEEKSKVALATTKEMIEMAGMKGVEAVNAVVVPTKSSKIPKVDEQIKEKVIEKDLIVEPEYYDLNGDDDKDGYTNIEELKAETDPNDANSKPNKKTPEITNLEKAKQVAKEAIKKTLENKKTEIDLTKATAGEKEIAKAKAEKIAEETKIKIEKATTEALVLSEGTVGVEKIKTIKVLIEKVIEKDLIVEPEYYDLNGDDDKDGYTNIEELKAETDPNDANSKPMEKTPSKDLIIEPEYYDLNGDDDKDGYTNEEELKAGTDTNDSNSKPKQKTKLEKKLTTTGEENTNNSSVAGLGILLSTILLAFKRRKKIKK